MKKLIKDERMRALIGLGFMAYFNGMPSLMKMLERMVRKPSEERYIALKPLFSTKEP